MFEICEENLVFYLFNIVKELLELCCELGFSVLMFMMYNEKIFCSEKDIKDELFNIW